MTYDLGLVNSKELESRAERSGAGAATFKIITNYKINLYVCRKSCNLNLKFNIIFLSN